VWTVGFNSPVLWRLARAGSLLLLTALLHPAGADSESALRSGPQVGGRPLPFTSNLVTGPQRGRQYCYVCELKDEPAVLVFARHPDEATARLLRELRDAVREHEKAKLFGWMVFLAQADTDSERELERQAYGFAKQNNATALPVSVLGDPQGPPGYLISPDAEVTVIVFQRAKVLYNHAYRAREWSSKTAASALKELPRLLSAPRSG
jgi:hypothetical protein